jgi:hypothetical protein
MPVPERTAAGERHGGHPHLRDAQHAAGRPLLRERGNGGHGGRLVFDVLVRLERCSLRDVPEPHRAGIHEGAVEEDATGAAPAVVAAPSQRRDTQ